MRLGWLEVHHVAPTGCRRLWIGGDLACPKGVLTPRVLDLEKRSPVKGTAFVCNLEGALSEREAVGEDLGRKGYVIYSMPNLVAWFREIGGVAVSLANNHIGDLRDGIGYTVEMLDRHEIGYYGLWKDNVMHVACVMVGGRRVYLVGGVDPTAGAVWRLGDGWRVVSLESGDVEKSIQWIRQCDPEAIIICTPHWGYENVRIPSPWQVEWARRFLNAGANHVVGHHSHVRQSVEVVGKKWIVYGVGNFFFPSGQYPGLFVRGAVGWRTGGVFEVVPATGLRTLRVCSTENLLVIGGWTVSGGGTGWRGLGAKEFRRSSGLRWYVPVGDPRSGAVGRVWGKLWLGMWQIAAATRRKWRRWRGMVS